MLAPKQFRERSESEQVLLGGVVPMAIGALAGVLVGVSSAGYWAVAALAAVGALLSGFEHADGWDAADRGFLSGLIYGTTLLLVHELINAHPKVSLGSAPALLAVITALGGAVLAGAGGHLARVQRQRTTAGAVASARPPRAG